MRSTLSALALVSFLLLGAGCKKGPSLVGKWNAQQGVANVEFEFKPDNTYAMSTKAGQFGMTAKGDYKVDGEKLTLTTKDFEAPGLPPALLQQAKQSPDFNKPRNVTLKFISDDEVSLSGIQTGGAAPQSLDIKREKS